MADYNLIQRGDLQTRLVSALQIRERSPAPTLEPTIQATVLLEDLTKQSAFVQPLTRRLWSSTRTAPVAALFPLHTISNPTGSGTIVIVESVYSSTSIGGSVRFGRLTGAVATVLATTDWFDRRNNPPLFAIGQGAVIARANSDFAATQIAFPFATMLGIGGPYPVGLVLLPGESFGVEREAVNSQLDSSIVWTELIS